MTDEFTHEVQDLQTLITQIVDLREQVKQVEADRQRTQERLNELSTQLLTLKTHMREARNLLDHCLDTGEDVTAVKLTKTSSELTTKRNMLMETDRYFKDTYESQYIKRERDKWIT